MRCARGLVRTVCLLLILLAPWSGTRAQQQTEGDAEGRRQGWTNSTDFSLVVTEGNSNTETFGLKNDLERRWERSTLRMKIEGLRSDTADDRFRQADAGFTWMPGEMPPPTTSTLVEPSTAPDAEKYLVEARFDRAFSHLPLREQGKGTATWGGGASWDRDRDAGILKRIVVFANLGHIWRDRDDFRFKTSYGLSLTDREEETIDPEKEQQFYGFRLTSQFLDRWGGQTTFTNDWKFNLNLEDTNDWSSHMTTAVAVSMSTHLSLKVSLQWLYNSEPALEDIDLVARVILIDPDGIPGNGDEFFETVSDGGASVDLGSVQERKKELDTVVRTSLAISF